MAWQSLKSAVGANIKANSNQEITGNVLQSVLTGIIDSLGENFSFAGIAKPNMSPGTPDGPVFYLAVEPGVYSGFSGIEITEEDACAKILKYDNGVWSAETTGIVKESALNELNTRIDPILNDIQLEEAEDNNFIWAVQDKDGKFLFGIKEDGSVEWNKGIPSPIFLQLLKLKLEIDKVINNLSGKVTKEKAKSLAHDFINDMLNTVEVPEDYIEMTVDSENRVLSYRHKDGTKHEEKMSATSLLVSEHIRLGVHAMNELAEALASFGIAGSNTLDLSDKSSIQIAEPKCAVVNITNITAMPTTKTDDLQAYIEFWDGQGNYFKKRAILNAQGSSSMYHDKKNYAVDFCEDEWIGDETTTVRIGNWVPQDSFHVKAFYFDAFRGVCPVAYKLWDEVYRSRGIMNDRPYKYLYINEYTDYGYGNGPDELEKNYMENARTFPDGFPVITFLNGKFYGVFSWQLKKHRDNMMQNKKNDEHIHLDLSLHSPWSGDGGANDVEWADFEIRNPKDLYCQDGTKYDGEVPKEIMGTDSLYYDASNEKHVRTAKVKAHILDTRAKFKELWSMKDRGESEENIRQHILSMWDVDRVIDYIIMTQATGNTDSYCRNVQWATWDSKKWACCPYDWDSMWGCGLIALARKSHFFKYWTCDPNVANDPKKGVYQPFSWVFNYFMPEIKARYKYLRESGILTTENIVKHLSDWTSRIGIENYKKEFEKWSLTPSWRSSNIDSVHWELTRDQQVTPDADGNVRYTSDGKTIVVPKYSQSTQYNIGDECYYGFENEWVKEYWRFKCISTCKGSAPITAFYNKSPYTMGYYESIYRVKLWSDSMLEWMDSQLM